jgi:hypothetical protein
LPEAVRGKMEAALGTNFSDVRVHICPQAERIGALAFTMGTDIYFAPGSSGCRYLARQGLRQRCRQSMSTGLAETSRNADLVI